MPGVKEIEEYAFHYCRALTYIECGKLERIEQNAFRCCESLMSVDLPSIRIVMVCAFECCSSLTHAKFGMDLEKIGRKAFRCCHSLERITIPLKDGLIDDDNIFARCKILRHVDFLQGVHETIAALQNEVWENDVNKEIAAFYRVNMNIGKAKAIREWIRSVLRKLVHYKHLRHRHILNVAAARLQRALPSDIVHKNVLPYLELPRKELPPKRVKGRKRRRRR